MGWGDPSLHKGSTEDRLKSLLGSVLATGVRWRGGEEAGWAAGWRAGGSRLKRRSAIRAALHTRHFVQLRAHVFGRVRVHVHVRVCVRVRQPAPARRRRTGWTRPWHPATAPTGGRRPLLVTQEKKHSTKAKGHSTKRHNKRMANTRVSSCEKGIEVHEHSSVQPTVHTHRCLPRRSAADCRSGRRRRPR